MSILLLKDYVASENLAPLVREIKSATIGCTNRLDPQSGRTYRAGAEDSGEF